MCSCQVLSRLGVREEILGSVHAYRLEINEKEKKTTKSTEGAERGLVSVEALP